MPNLSIHTAGRVYSYCENTFEQDPQNFGQGLFDWTHHSTKFCSDRPTKLGDFTTEK